MTSQQNHDENGAAPPASGTLAMAFASLGVVFGDIGTSPLYAMREALRFVAIPAALTREDVIGVASLFIWSLFAIVTLKYVILLMRADNRGEGGILSLTALLSRVLPERRSLLLLAGILGASLFVGDAMITPAISVLSAVEGAAVANAALAPFAVPAALVILSALFYIQRFGTARVAALFAPIMFVWFAMLAFSGLIHIADDPGIFRALDPTRAIVFLIDYRAVSFVVLGGVFLSVTGAEALYADMGHLGRRPIQIAWIAVVFPALVLNYLGQGAFLLANPGALHNPFFLMVPGWALVPLIGLATIVTVIASQAVISGAFSIARQAVQLGLLPRLEFTHTSESEHGQIYAPQINLLLYIGVFTLIVGFQSSANLASAYGISVNAAMIIDGIMGMVLFWSLRRRAFRLLAVILLPLVLLELGFFGSNLSKLLDGGFVPLIIAAAVSLIMLTWVKGQKLLGERITRQSLPLEELLTNLETSSAKRVDGTAIFPITHPEFAPSAFLHNLKHNHVLHRHIVFVHVRIETEPRVDPADRVEVRKLPLEALHVTVRFGFTEEPDLPAALKRCADRGSGFDVANASYFLGYREVNTSRSADMPLWQQRLFTLLSSFSSRPARFYSIPLNRMVELGQQVSL